MRPLTLHMEAFGPFAGSETVDFTDLGERSLFLIAGPTGAGKSSILDAICFALYGESSGAEREASQLRSDFAEPTLPTRVTFTFQNGSKRYRVSRSPKHLLAKKRGSGSTERPATAELVELPSSASGTPDVLATKVNECRTAIEEILGLNSEQFRQVVVIPQGKFREMLTAKSEERERIFQNLFSAGHYKTILDRLKSASRGLVEDLERNRERRSTVLAQSGAETLDVLQERIRQEKDSLQTLAGERDSAAQALQRAAQRLALARDLAQIWSAISRNRQELTASQAGLARAETAFLEAGARLTQEEQAEPERHRLRQQLTRLEGLRPLLQQYGETLRQSVDATQSLSRCQESMLATSARLQTARQQEKPLQDQLDQARARAAKAGEQELLLEKISHSLDRRKQVERLARELEETRTQLALAEKQGQEQRKLSGDAEAKLQSLQQQRHDGRAALLSAELRPGQACPVCGSSHHPAPAPVDRSIPSQAAIEEAERQRKAANDALVSAREHYIALQRDTKRMQDQLAEVQQTVAAELSLAQLEEQRAGVRAVLAEAKSAATSAARLQKERLTLAQEIETLVLKDKELQARSLDLQTRAAAAQSRMETLSAQIDPAFREPGKLEEELASAARQLQQADTRLRQVREARQSAETARTRLQTQIAEQARQAETHAEAYRSAREALVLLLDDGLTTPPEPLTGPELEDLVERLAREEAAGRAAMDERNTRFGAQTHRITTLEQQARQVADLSAQFAKMDAQYQVVGRLAEVADGRNSHRLTFPRFVLGAILDDVLRCATHRLLLMSRRRFELYRSRESRRAGGLELEVMDHHTGIARSVATLSGGESFLASLSLALGLADITQSYAGGIRVETMFIDEGFGSLDAEALDLAFSTLYDLQKQGRLIGVISHVAELKERIDARLEVTPTPGGSHTRFVL